MVGRSEEVDKNALRGTGLDRVKIKCTTLILRGRTGRRGRGVMTYLILSRLNLGIEMGITREEEIRARTKKTVIPMMGMRRQRSRRQYGMNLGLR
jgi:hypothetical protein